MTSSSSITSSSTRVLDRVADWRAWPSWVRAGLGAWIAARLVIAISYLLAWIADDRGAFGPQSRVSEGLFAWDGGWYRFIADHGFRPDGEEVRFSPVYPWMARAVGAILGIGSDWALLLIANGAALAASMGAGAYAMILLRSPHYRDRGIAPDTMAWCGAAAVALWPGNYVLAWAYTEPTLIAASLGAVIAARHYRWGWAALAGGLAGAIRPTGMAIAIVLGVIAIEQWPHFRPPWRHIGPIVPPPNGSSASSPWAVGRRLIAIGAPVGGFGIHLWAAHQAGAHWWDPVAIQSPLRGAFMDPLSRIARGVGDVLGPERFGDGLHLPMACIGIGLVAACWYYFGVADALGFAAVTTVALSAENWNSLERYLANSYALAITIGFALGLWNSRQAKRGRWLIGGVGAFALGAFAIAAWSGRFVP